MAIDKFLAGIQPKVIALLFPYMPLSARFTLVYTQSADARFLEMTWNWRKGPLARSQ